MGTSEGLRLSPEFYYCVFFNVLLYSYYSDKFSLVIVKFSMMSLSFVYVSACL